VNVLKDNAKEYEGVTWWKRVPKVADILPYMRHVNETPQPPIIAAKNNSHKPIHIFYKSVGSHNTILLRHN